MTETRGAAWKAWARPVRYLGLAAGVVLAAGSRWLALPAWINLALIAAAAALGLALSIERGLKPGENEMQRRQRMRNIAIGWALFGLVFLFYVATMARLGGNALNRPI
jgi:hypothetical protein